jgi:uncharacterized protein (DUF885 family)
MKPRLPWMPPRLYQSLHPAEQAFYDIAHNYFERIFHYSPVYATWAGDRAYDDRLGTARNALMMMPESIDFKLLEQLRQMDPDLFSDDGWADYHALYAMVDTEIEINHWLDRKRDLSIIIEIVVDSIYLLLNSTSGRLDEHRLWAVLARLEQIPRTLQAERRDKRKAVAYWAELAIETAEGAERYLEQLFVRLARVKNAQFQRQLRRIRQQVMDEFQVHQDWLAHKLDYADDHFAAGDKLLARVIKYGHGIDKTPEAIARMGYRLIEETEAELAREARKLGWLYWRELLDVVRQRNRPKTEDIKGHYRDEVDALKNFVAKNKLVTLPGNEQLSVVDSPPYFEQFIPSAAYMPPGPFQRVCRGQFFVTQPPATMARSSRLRCLESHAAPHLTAAHEGYPGHHLQLTIAAQHPRKLRAMFDSPYLSEGWGLYCEQLIEREGYSFSRYDRFMRLADKLWRAWRILIDIRLHQGKWSPERCAAILVAEANFEPTRARREINWYTQRPAYPMCYLLGAERIQQLENQATQKGMTPLQFRDKLLSYGSISPEWIAGVIFR